MAFYAIIVIAQVFMVYKGLQKHVIITRLYMHFSTSQTTFTSFPLKLSVKFLLLYTYHKLLV